MDAGSHNVNDGRAADRGLESLDLYNNYFLNYIM